MNRDSPISAVVLTFNEALNIERTLRHLAPLARECLVVDSGSTDGTPAIAERCGARVVSNAFVSHAAQWDFALAQPLEGDWVLALDADQVVTPELGEDLLRLARDAGPGIEGVFLNRLNVFRGRELRHGGLFPKWMLKMFRRGAGRTDRNDLFDLRFDVQGGTTKARGLLLEDNANERDIAFWIEKHNRYARKLAAEELRRRREGGGSWSMRGSVLGSPDQRLALLKSLWNRLPRYTRPILYFGYRYLLRLGFLDGKQGFLFHFLQALWFRILVDIQLDDLEAAAREAPSPPPAS